MTWLSPLEGHFLKSLRTPQHLESLRRLVCARNTADLTQKELATRLKRHQSFVAKYEGGERRIEIIEFVQICNALDVAPESLLRKLS